MVVLYVLLGLVVLIGLWAMGVYNGLIQLRNKSDEGFSDIETQLKRRYDLIPNLVETVKGYAGHEKETLEKVTQARNMAVDASKMGDMQGMAQAEGMLSGMLKSLFAVSESYPELKADKNFMDLQSTLKEVEEHIQMSRRYYNGTVRDFNNKVEMFPGSIVAGMFNFPKREFFEVENEEEKKNVKVSFKK